MHSQLRRRDSWKTILVHRIYRKAGNCWLQQVRVFPAKDKWSRNRGDMLGEFGLKDGNSAGKAREPAAGKGGEARPSLEELETILDTSPQGLSQTEAQRRLEQYGYNELAEAAERPCDRIDEYQEFSRSVIRWRSSARNSGRCRASWWMSESISGG